VACPRGARVAFVGALELLSRVVWSVGGAKNHFEGDTPGQPGGGGCVFGGVWGWGVWCVVGCGRWCCVFLLFGGFVVGGGGVLGLGWLLVGFCFVFVVGVGCGGVEKRQCQPKKKGRGGGNRYLRSRNGEGCGKRSTDTCRAGLRGGKEEKRTSLEAFTGRTEKEARGAKCEERGVVPDVLRVGVHRKRVETGGGGED